MSISIKVSIRCRPFTCKDKLGIMMQQNSEEEGEVQLLNSTYSTTRFAFTYSWWSAYGYQRHVQDSPPEADAMKLIDQSEAYKSVGLKIKNDLLTGNAVVLFAYGLSGSGKTFTVFGPDAVDAPEAWFKHEDPHPLWGIFPRLAYEVFKEKEDGWKISMKYFQNVVDTVRDLMSPMAKEQQYKSGMRKDEDGFMDIQWCQSVVLKDWKHLRETFMSANARKAIAPTQFNHQSTRGHCIMTLEVEKPDPEREGMKQRGRVYVCDLAGTEPAGDIVYAQYKKKTYENGDIEYNYTGPHPDGSKSKELQDQGKKINLSLTEMAQFFMKMAEAVKAKKLKPGSSIPGCNSYFLCKYLKDTMLQARTYLFCAIRPEVKFHNYTFSTLGFAKNASVIKLQPKRATTAASPAERKLMAELEQMKLLVAELQSKSGATTSGDPGQGEELQRLLAMKQKELESVLSNDSANNQQDEMMQQQRTEYGQRGISLAYFEKDTKLPHLINVDVDSYRSKRFMFLIDRDQISVGLNGDIKPMSLGIVADHCSFLRQNEEISLQVGAGEIVYNGEMLTSGDQKSLKTYDRIAIGNELMIFIDPSSIPDTPEPTADEAAQEYQKAVQSGDAAAVAELQAQLRKFEEEKAEWERKKEQASSDEVAEMEKAQDLEKEKIARQINDQELREVMPKIEEVKQIVHLLNRDMLSFDTALQGSGAGQAGIPKVKVKVHNSMSNETIFLDVFEFVKAHALLKDELVFLKNAVANNREYTAPEGHEPINLLFDNSFHIGSAIAFPEYLLYNLETDPDESHINIKLAVPPFGTIGKLEVIWTPLGSPDPDVEADPADVDDPSELIGKSWTFRLTIKGAAGLPILTDLAYCQYEFFGELYTTETVEQNTRSPQFDYSYIHHIDCVTQPFIEYLQHQRIEFAVFISPYVMDPPKDKISTDNPVIVTNLGGTPVIKATYEELETKCGDLDKERKHMESEIQYLREKFKEATGQEPPEFVRPAEAAAASCTPRKQIEEARNIDSDLNA